MRACHKGMVLKSCSWALLAAEVGLLVGTPLTLWQRYCLMWIGFCGCQGYKDLVIVARRFLQEQTVHRTSFNPESTCRHALQEYVMMNPIVRSFHLGNGQSQHLPILTEARRFLKRS